MLRHVLLIVGVLLFVTVCRTHADGIDDDRDPAAVIATLNNYMLDLNRLAEYAPTPLCNSTVNTAGLQAAANLFVDKYFSKSVQRYVAAQSTNGVPAGPVIMNYTVGTAQFANPAALHSFLKSFYASFIPFFSYPFYWVLSAPIVTIKRCDSAYARQTTAYVRANNVNSGFTCFGTRAYRTQNSEYQHVFVYDDDLNRWQYISFVEVNKGTIFAPQAPVQSAP